MHIAIDTSPLESAHSVRGTGIYTKLLVEALQKHETSHTYSFFTRSQKVPNNADLVHYPYFDPFFLTLPVFHNKPVVVTVHDLIPIRFPDKFPRGIRGSLKWGLQRTALGRAERIITDSLCSGRDIERFVHFSKEKIDVIYLAASDEYGPETDTKTLDIVRRKYSLPKYYLVYTGDINWNKNVPGFLEAFGKITPRKDIHLLLVGKSFLQGELPEVREIRHTIETNGIQDNVRMLGFVPTEDLRSIYTLGQAAILPSFYEGFGLPVLEAMACGAPAIVAKGSSLDEIAGPALRIDPYDVGTIAKGISEVFAMSESEHRILSEASRAWANSFTWEKVAKETVVSYRKALHGS